MMRPVKISFFIFIMFGVLSCQTIIPAADVATASPDLPVEITDVKGVTMRLVPAGEFIMGSEDDESGYAKPAHMVTLPGFYMDVYEVTRARYKECVTAGVCSESRNLAGVDAFYAYPDNPMASVDWNQSKTYCETWRGARLPSEAEWEKAARGTDGRTYPWGEEYSSTYVKTETGSPDNVGMYEKGKSPYGMYDMAGGVWEWVSDPFIAYSGNSGEGVFWPENRVLRGGSWFYPDSYALRTWFRYGSPPEATDGSFGFRCARDVP